jgi:hypothetical protein
MIGWQLFAKAGIVQWCGHDHHFLVVPHADGERAVLGADPRRGGVNSSASIEAREIGPLGSERMILST